MSNGIIIIYNRGQNPRAYGSTRKRTYSENFAFQWLTNKIQNPSPFTKSTFLQPRKPVSACALKTRQTKNGFVDYTLLPSLSMETGKPGLVAEMCSTVCCTHYNQYIHHHMADCSAKMGGERERGIRSILCVTGSIFGTLRSCFIPVALQTKCR